MPLASELLAPIPGSNPSGIYLRYDPVYDRIKDARREGDAGGLAVDGEVKKADFALVVKLCSQELSKRTKDLDLAVWLSEALLRREGFPGLRDGLDLVYGLVEGFWDTLYPEIEDGDPGFRATPLQRLGTTFGETSKHVPLTNSGLDWIKYKESRLVGYEKDLGGSDSKTQKRAEAIQDGKLTAEEFDESFAVTPREFYEELAQNIDACLERLDSLDKLCNEKFGDEAPVFSPLQDDLREIRSSVGSLLSRKPAPEGEPEAQSSEVYAETAISEAAPDQATQPLARPAAPAASRAITAVPADLEDAVKRIVTIANWWRQQDSSSPVPYLLLRALRWGELRTSSSLDSSLLEAPDTELRKKVVALAADQSSDLVEAVENAMATPAGRAWLDLQRYAVSACESVGNAAIAQAIRTELRGLLEDYPELPDATLNDDTPTAGRETRKWISELGQAKAEPSIRELEPEAATENGETDVYQQATQIAASQPERAIEMLESAAARASSRRERFRRRVQLAQICLEAGYEDVALPILAGLSAEIDERKLEDWESSEWLAHPIALFYRCIRDRKDAVEQARGLYAQLCRIDPLQALTYAR